MRPTQPVCAWPRYLLAVASSSLVMPYLPARAAHQCPRLRPCAYCPSTESRGTPV